MLINLITAYRQSVALFTFVKLGVPFRLDAGKKLSLQELSVLCELNEDRLSRLLDVMAELKILRHERDRYSLAEGATALADENSLETLWILCELGEEYWSVWPYYASSMRTYSGKSAFEIKHGGAFFPYLKSNPGLKDIFDRLMAKITENLSSEIVRFIECNEHSEVVDVGGGKGILLRKLNQTCNLKSATVLDLYPEGSRTEDGLHFMNADFFKTIIAGKDIYIIKNIIHDWGDTQALRILTNIRKAMKDDSKLYVIEIIKTSESKTGKSLDLLMDALFLGKERYYHEYERLAKTAGFTVEQSIQTSLSQSIMIWHKDKK
ncbi:acetylserotonin O-methyltransferase [Enterobacter bugandensis]|uniref:acetylserotonin O-methyltransferase n=1 Tax=Enterobacter bugandensis TaxID=881260 RepID=UPI00207642EF|nr:acetylserotonin O-methyltransferase [Enterobacter bugandensis]MCM7239260.1 acetylserotonin O-methyltransferase [Enterobacter bugandensis]MCM7319043.1 acetylserotonin O-methyltransferase [Enterobacter bugandensis]MCM7354630.1 acetylserotonin O-methyltransferase [Enterobacter bugandensis]